MNKQIANVVFYKFLGEQGIMQQACIFYADGTVQNVSYEEGIDAAYEIAKEEGIKNQEEFINIQNKRRIFSLSGEEFERRSKEFIATKAVLTPSNQTKPAIQISTKESSKTTGAPNIVGLLPPAKSPEKNEKKKKNKKGLFNKLWTKVTALVVAGAMLLTGGYFLGRNTKAGKIIKNNISTVSQTKEQIPIQDVAYANLIKTTENASQKNAMQYQDQKLDIFNKDFAKAHIEKGKDVKAALTWDEMIALNIAYNTYSKKEIKAMFNGAEVSAHALSNAFKNANLQLMGAYVISTRKNPVNSSQFLINEKQQAFVEKYNDLFLKCKETTKENQIKAIDAFYAELYKDFPINAKKNEEGISHADTASAIEPYKTAIIPIVSAAEIMFQNKGKIDHTLADKAIKYFNNLGLCNIVDEKFERAETITLTSDTNEKMPLYETYRSAKITELVYEKNYPTNDAGRDLSQLTEFKKWVNGSFEIVDGVNTGKIIKTETKSSASNSTKTTSSTSTSSKTNITSNREEAVKKSSEKAVSEAENKVDKEIAQKNKNEKKKQEELAENNRKEQQEKEDKKTSKLEDQVAASDKELQGMIDDANNRDKVNEEDFGEHGVDFSPEYSDNNGNLDNSVGNITTDSTGAVDSKEPLPDPNKTGAQFESGNFNSSGTTSKPNGSVADKNTSGQDIYSYEEAYNLTNEQIVDAYIASLENQGATETSRQYTL